MFPLVMQHRLKFWLNWQASKPLQLEAFVAEDEMWNRGVGHRTDIGCLLPVIRMLPRLSVQIHRRGFRQLSSLLSTYFSSILVLADASIAACCTQH